jgi:hypothetical protein
VDVNILEFLYRVQVASWAGLVIAGVLIAAGAGRIGGPRVLRWWHARRRVGVQVRSDASLERIPDEPLFEPGVARAAHPFGDWCQHGVQFLNECEDCPNGSPQVVA